MALQPLLGPDHFFSSVFIFYTDGRTPWTSYKTVTRPLPTHRTTQTHNEHIHRHPCLEWDSNPRSQRLSERRQSMPNVDLYSGGARFESRPVHQLSWLKFLWFSSLFPDEFQYLPNTASFQVLSSSFFMYHSTIRRYIVSILKGSLNNLR
jgi:hypothetical protein